MLRWIQSSRQEHILGPLLAHLPLIKVANDMDHYINRLQAILRKIEKHSSELKFSSKLMKYKNNESEEDLKSVVNGCCWSQFVIIMYLLCTFDLGKLFS